MKKLTVSLLLVSLFGVCQAQQKMHIETNLGSATGYANASSSESKLSWGLGLGYKINSNLAVVGKYQSLYKDLTYTSDSFSVRAVGILPISREVSLNAKIGIGKTSFQSKVRSATGTFNYGIGADYAITREFSMGLDADFYSTDENNYFPKISQTNISVVGKYKF